VSIAEKSGETVQTEANADDLVTAFASRLQPLGVRVERVKDGDATAAFLGEIKDEVGAPGLVVAAELLAEAPSLAAALAARGVVWSAPGGVEAARDAPLGVSLARLGVAETGSVMLAEETLEDRAVGMLSKANVVVVRTDSIVPSLVEAGAALRSHALRPGGGYASLVTGPSRTADIELSLSLGVQGPERLLIVVVDELS
jgi:L-lactate dehydrogenase complex protein LldG